MENHKRRSRIMKKNDVGCSVCMIALFLLFCGVGGCGKKASPPGNALVNTIDEDGDGYFGSFDVRIDANGQFEDDTLDVKARIICPDTQDTIWTDVWTLTGKTAEDAFTQSFSSSDFQLTEPTEAKLTIELYDSAGVDLFDADSSLQVLLDDDDSTAHYKTIFAKRSLFIENPRDRDGDQFLEKFDLKIDADVSAPKTEKDIVARIISKTTGDTIWTDSWQVKGSSQKDVFTKTFKAEEFTLDEPLELALTVALFDSSRQELMAIDSSLTVKVDYDSASILKAAFPREERRQDSPELPPVPVEIATVERGAVSSYLVATATLESEKQADVVAKVSGLVDQLFVEEGHWVRQGDILARLDEKRLKIQVDQALVEMNRLEAYSKRGGDLFKKELISEEEYENLRYQHEAQKAAYELARLDLEYSSIKAPISGVITERLIRIGNQVNVNQKVFAIANFNPLVARVFVPENEMRRLKVNQPVKIIIDADGDELHEGRVTRVSPVVDPASGTVKATVEVTGSSNKTLKPGMCARLKIITDTKPDAIVVPKRALVSDDGKQAVFVVSNDLAPKRPVEVGFNDEGRVEILSGLEEGDQVVTIGQSGLKDSTKVEIIE